MPAKRYFCINDDTELLAGILSNGSKSSCDKSAQLDGTVKQSESVTNGITEPSSTSDGSAPVMTKAHNLFYPNVTTCSNEKEEQDFTKPPNCSIYKTKEIKPKQTLDDMNIGYFDNWASVFGVITQSIEVKPSGDGFRPRTRFSNFVNLNELCNLFGEVFDIAKTADMNLKLPAIQKGKPEMIIFEKSPEQELQTDAGIERARRIEAKMVQPDEDNMLAVCTYMTKVALDARIIDPEAEEYDGGKVALCAEKIIEINKANPGTAQAVFCDTNTPKKDAFSVYQALRERLVRSGEFAEDEIAFVHDAANDKQRLAMFEKVNNAEIKIIIGSTGKLGTGVNIQRKLSALHHLDAPYRPSDVEHTERNRGRPIIRQIMQIKETLP